MTSVVTTSHPAIQADSDSLLKFNSKDSLSLREAFEGVQIFGGTGSGKTSGSGRAIADALLKSGFGGVVLTAKPEDAAHWRSLCTSNGRASDLRVFSPESDLGFDFIAYEASRSDSKSTTYDLVSLLTDAINGGRSRESLDPYWDDTLRQLLLNTIDLLRLADSAIGLTHIISVVRSAPRDLKESDGLAFSERDDERPRTGTFCKLVRKAYARAKRDAGLRSDFAETYEYWMRDLPSLSSKTRTSIESMLLSKATSLLRRPFRSLLCRDDEGTTPRNGDCLPEATFDGRVLVLDLPVKVYGDAGRLAQVLYKTVWQRAVERRCGGGRPVFLWADESQYFVSEADIGFQQTARSSRCVTVLLTQSLANYQSQLGGGQDAITAVDSIMANLQTKIFHANSDPVTNEWAERVFGQVSGQSKSTGIGSGGATFGSQDASLPVVSTIDFGRLRRGGPQHGMRVDAFVFKGGAPWVGGARHRFKPGQPWSPGETGENALLATFEQHPLDG